MGAEGQRDRKSDTPQTAVPHLNHMWVERVHACPGVSQMTVPLWAEELNAGRDSGCCCAAGVSCTHGLPCLLVNFTGPDSLPAPTHLPGFHPQLPGSSRLPLAFSRPHAGHTVERQEPAWLCCPGMLSWAVHTGMCSLSWIKPGAQQGGGGGTRGVG